MNASLFPTELGWFALIGEGDVVHRLSIGHADEAAAWEATVAGEAFEDCDEPARCDWHPELRRRLEAFARGEESDFSDVTVAARGGSTFQQKVVAETRALGFGETTTYGELARRAGSPNAARAVGRVMATNRVPIVIPCHRVLAANGALGGFSAPTGTDLKSEMLSRESVVVS